MSPNVIIPSKIAGVTFDDPVSGLKRQEIIRQFVRSDMPLILLAEPDNPADPNAVGVWIEHAGRQYHLGYLNQYQAERVNAAWARGETVSAQVKEITGGGSDKPMLGVNIALNVPLTESELEELSRSRNLVAESAAVRKPKKRSSGCLKIALIAIGIIVLLLIIASLTNSPSDTGMIAPMSVGMALSGPVSKDNVTLSFENSPPRQRPTRRPHGSGA